jgi:transcriptional regulator with XRE-family HTH domain
MNSLTPTGMMIDALKDEFKARGIHYRTVAERLKVSEATIKRYLRGNSVTLTAVQKMAEIVNLDVLSLASLAQRKSRVDRAMSKLQEEELSKDRNLRGTLYFLGRGWTPAQIGTEFGITNQLASLLARLVDLGLIRRVSADSFKILARPSDDAKRAGPLSTRTLELARQFVSTLNLRDSACSWLFYQARLSPGSEVAWRDMMKRFDAELRTLGMTESDRPPHKGQWYRFFLGARTLTAKQLL